MILGYFDLIVIGSIFLANIFFWKKRFRLKARCMAAIIIGFILPIISQWVEIRRVVSQLPEGEFYDSIELLYTYLRFPVYWVVVIIQSAILTRWVTVEQEDKQDEVDSEHSD
jgi:hypothetical protein